MYADSLTYKLLVILLLVVPMSHRTPEVTDVCCHAFAWVLGVQTWVPRCVCGRVCAH